MPEGVAAAVDVEVAEEEDVAAVAVAAAGPGFEPAGGGVELVEAGFVRVAAVVDVECDEDEAGVAGLRRLRHGGERLGMDRRPLKPRLLREVTATKSPR